VHLLHHARDTEDERAFERIVDTAIIASASDHDGVERVRPWPLPRFCTYSGLRQRVAGGV
jgi:hypothetical protein